MSNPSNSRADDAYGKAVGAYQERSYDLARRWVLEALAQDPQHAGARALLGRLDAARRAATPFPPSSSSPEVVSTDPTVLISRASRPSSEPIEPTVMVRREDPRKRLGDTDVHPVVAAPPRHAAARPAAEPTMIVQAKDRGASARRQSSFSLGAMVQSIGQAFGGGGRPPSPPRRHTVDSRPGDRRAGRPATATRGALIAFGVVVLAALFVWAVILASRWYWPAGQLLTLTKPVGGTIVGPGLNCGTRGSECSTTRPTGDPVELEARADSGYVFSGFTGDCAPTGRTSMSQPRTCGATFDTVSASPTAVNFKLTITKPTGGTVVGAGGILCGTLGTTCSADVPSGVPVTLHFEADAGYTFSQFTGDCAANGETNMTSSKTCGATFTPTSTPVANVVPGPPVGPSGPPRPKRPRETVDVAPPRPAPSTQAPTLPSPATPTPTAPAQGVEGTPTNPDKPAAPPITAEEHAKNEIQQLVKNYCAELETLDPGRIQKLFPLANSSTYRELFRQYKSLKCSVTSPPDFDRLDARAAGGAQVKFGMKEIVQMRSGGAPQTLDLIVTMVVSRMNLQSPWLIDRVQVEQKPKS